MRAHGGIGSIALVLAACGGGEGGGPDRAAWLGMYAVTWTCASPPCAVLPDVSVATTASVVANPQSDDGVNVVFMPAMTSSGIVAPAVPDGDGYRLVTLFDGNGAWGTVVLGLTDTGFGADAVFTPTGGGAQMWSLAATASP